MLAVVLAPKLASVLVILFGLQLLLADTGPVNRALVATGLIAAPLQLLRGPAGAVIGEATLILPYSILIIYTHLLGLDPLLEPAAARGWGASAWQRFVRVTLRWRAGAGARRRATLVWGSRRVPRPAATRRTGGDNVVGRGPPARIRPAAGRGGGRGGPAHRHRAGCLAAYTRDRPLAEADDAPARVAAIGLLTTVFPASPLGYAVWVSFSPDSFLTPPAGRWSLRWYAAYLADRRWTARPAAGR
ncbi:MAG: hypothetical protein U0736_20910 [Gemmataceae bacterium]